MLLDPLAVIAQIIGGLALVVSLVALAFEVRQNTRAVRASSYNAMVTNSIELASAVWDTPDLAIIFTKAQQDPALLDDIGRLKWHAFMLAMFRHWDNLQYQAARGSLESELWESYQNTISTWLKTPGWLEWFHQNGYMFTKSLQQLVAAKAYSASTKEPAPIEF